MSTATLELKDDAHCFVCGKANIYGLQLVWKTVQNMTTAEFYPSKAHQGWQGIVHGGILATILDEAMTRLAWQIHGGSVTAEITVRYFNSARIGEKLAVRGEIGAANKRLIPAKAEIRNGGGRLIATATGKILKVREKAA
jgi:uncharacterized protein (TIGR00369 family)